MVIIYYLQYFFKYKKETRPSKNSIRRKSSVSLVYSSEQLN